MKRINLESCANKCPDFVKIFAIVLKQRFWFEQLCAIAPILVFCANQIASQSVYSEKTSSLVQISDHKS